MSKRRPQQKYHNAVAFKVGKYGLTPSQQIAQQASISNVCARCREVLEWKKKYGKYKPRTTPGRCSKCEDKTVKKAYMLVCVPCARKLRICAKCCEKQEENVFEESEDELRRQELEEQRMLQGMTERQRRAYVRKQEQDASGKRSSKDQGDEDADSDGHDEDGGQDGGDEEADGAGDEDYVEDGQEAEHDQEPAADGSADQGEGGEDDDDPFSLDD